MTTMPRTSFHEQSRRSLCLFLVFLYLFSTGASLSWGQESVLDRGPAPDSVHELNSPLDIPFLPLAPFPLAFTALRDSIRASLKPELETLPPFFRDTQVGLNLRMYYFDRENHVSPAKSDNEVVPGVVIVRVEAPLVYFNAGYVSDVVRRQVHAEATPVQMVVWDLSSSLYVDVVGARMLADVQEVWSRQGIQLRLADAHAEVRDILRAEGLEARVNRIDRRTSVDDIVMAFRPVS